LEKGEEGQDAAEDCLLVVGVVTKDRAKDGFADEIIALAHCG
jgi:hypothetical protein